MKKIFYAGILFTLFSCRKEKSAPIDFSLLQKYNWQSIEKRQMKNDFDTSQLISYADTSFYSFEEAAFTTRYQATTISFIIGSGGDSYFIHQVTGRWEGQYIVNENDSTITFSGTRHSPVYDPLRPPAPGPDSVFTETTTAKILLLNKDVLKIKAPRKDPVYLKVGNKYYLVYDTPGYLSLGGGIFTYNSLKK